MTRQRCVDVPHNIQDLIYLMGGKAAFVERLNQQFEWAAPNRLVTAHGGNAEKWVDYANQPSVHMAQLFSDNG